MFVCTLFNPRNIVFFSIENEKKNRLWPFSTVFVEKARIRLSIVLRLMENNEQN